MPTETLTFFGMSEATVRAGVFLFIFVGMSVLEAWKPRRSRLQKRTQRWTTNGGMLIIATLLVQAISVIAPLVAASAAAVFAYEMGWGLFNLVKVELWLEIILVIVLLDLAIWFQHLISHKVPVLWRLHRVHHSDRDLDASSALRFHPVEIALSAAYKLAIVLLLGPVTLAVVLFEIILNASAMFNHANLSIPIWLDRALRVVFITPDMHRVHHSVDRAEHDNNYGFCLSIWDRVFGTYTSQPKHGHINCLLYTSPSPRDATLSRMPSSA